MEILWVIEGDNSKITGRQTGKTEVDGKQTKVTPYEARIARRTDGEVHGRDVT